MSKGQILDGWIEARGKKDGPLILAISRKGRVLKRGLTGHGVYRLLERRGKEACVEVFSPHDLRRSFVSNLLGGSADLSTVQKMAGRADPSTTARYDMRGEGAKRTAADLLHIPPFPNRQSAT